eukprot:gene9647-5544_t
MDKAVSVAKGRGQAKDAAQPPGKRKQLADDADWSAMAAWSITASHDGFLSWCRKKYSAVPRWVMRAKANRFSSVAAASDTLARPLRPGVEGSPCAAVAIREWIMEFKAKAADQYRVTRLAQCLGCMTVKMKSVIKSALFVKVTYPF